MIKESKNILPPSIGIRRIDGITFELYQIKENQVVTILKETYPIVLARASAILQSLAEGAHNV